MHLLTFSKIEAAQKRQRGVWVVRLLFDNKKNYSIVNQHLYNAAVFEQAPLFFLL